MDAPTLSLIVPLHNEAPNLPRLLEACTDALERYGRALADLWALRRRL